MGTTQETTNMRVKITWWSDEQAVMAQRLLRAKAVGRVIEFDEPDTPEYRQSLRNLNEAYAEDGLVIDIDGTPFTETN